MTVLCDTSHFFFPVSIALSYDGSRRCVIEYAAAVKLMCIQSKIIVKKTTIKEKWLHMISEIEWYFRVALCYWLGHAWGPHQWMRVPIGGPYAIDGSFARCRRCLQLSKGRGKRTRPFFDYEDPSHPWRRKGWTRSSEGLWRHPNKPGVALTDYDPDPPQDSV